MMSLPVVPITSPWWRRFSRFAVIAGKKWKESERSEPRTSKQQDAGISNSKQAEAPPLFDFDFSAFWRSCLSMFPDAVATFDFEIFRAPDGRWQAMAGPSVFCVAAMCSPPHLFLCIQPLLCPCLPCLDQRRRSLGSSESFQRTPQHVFDPLWSSWPFEVAVEKVVGSLCDARFIY